MLVTQAAPRAAIVGRYAEAAVGGVLIVLLFDWEVTVETDLADLTAHGDYWKVMGVLDSGWTFRARGYVVPTTSTPLSYINDLYAAGTAPNQMPATVTVTGYSGSVAGNKKIFEGTGIPVRGTISAPMALAEQEFEVRGTGAPTTGV